MGWADQRGEIKVLIGRPDGRSLYETHRQRQERVLERARLLNEAAKRLTVYHGVARAKHSPLAPFLERELEEMEIQLDAAMERFENG